MTTKIDNLWKVLEEDHSFSKGILLRRYSPEVLPDIYVALRQPEKVRGIAVRLRRGDTLNLSEYSHLRDIRVEMLPDERDITAYYLLILLSGSQHQDVFATLCEDLIWGIYNLTQKDEIVKALLDRLEKWKSLFDIASSQELSPEEQRGLFGEVYLLRKWMAVSPDRLHCVDSWRGPDMELRDFQYGEWGIEVKTTFGSNHQRIHISNERQLDPSHLRDLFLYHLSVECQYQNGENLNQLISSVLAVLENDFIAHARFRAGLLKAGYLRQHQSYYAETGYHIRQEVFYAVRDAFPRLEEKDLRAGVGEVKYSIIPSNFADYIISESSVFKIINEYVRENRND